MLSVLRLGHASFKQSAQPGACLVTCKIWTRTEAAALAIGSFARLAPSVGLGGSSHLPRRPLPRAFEATEGSTCASHLTLGLYQRYCHPMKRKYEGSAAGPWQQLNFMIALGQFNTGFKRLEAAGGKARGDGHTGQVEASKANVVCMDACCSA